MANGITDFRMHNESIQKLQTRDRKLRMKDIYILHFLTSNTDELWRFTYASYPAAAGIWTSSMPARSTRAFAHKQAEQSDINTLSRLSAIIPSLKPVCNIFFFVCAFFKLGFSALDYGEETHTDTRERRYALPWWKGSRPCERCLAAEMKGRMEREK